MTEYKAVIGLEIHVQPTTKSKMFCSCSADFFNSTPNSHTCPVCLGLPGALPVTNSMAVEKALTLGLALNCDIAERLQFDRKHYFYPDLPKGYQISQYQYPLASDGVIKVSGKDIRINRVHLEEDTGKLFHKGDATLIDFNRSGMPLIEIVTEPDLDSASSAYEFLRELHLIITHLGISDGSLEKGTMRLEPNISVKVDDSDDTRPLYKVEVKNINSFKFARKAIDYEIERQVEILKSTGEVVQETRGWDEKTGITVSQRSKEETPDYRYFPEPDLPPVKISEELILRSEAAVAEHPDRKLERYKSLGVSDRYSRIMVTDKTLAEYVERAVESGQDAQIVANLIINKPEYRRIPPEKLDEYLVKQQSEILTDGSELDLMVESVLQQNENVVEEYISGKESALTFLIGQVMKESSGRASPQLAREVLLEKLSQKPT